MMADDNISVGEFYASKPNCWMFTINFFGKPITTTVTSNPSVVRKWIYNAWHSCRLCRNQLVVGLSVQWSPSFQPGANDPADILQLCVGIDCLIFQLAQADYVPNVLRRFLADPNTTFVGIWNNQDARKLSESKHELLVRNALLDLRYYVASEMERMELERASMETLVREFLGFEGVRKDPSVSMSEWDAYWLTDDQIQYACVDAHVSFEIGKNLSAWEIEKQSSFLSSGSDLDS